MKRQRGKTLIYDMLAILGWGAIAAGVGLWSVPAGIVIAGIGLLAAGLIGAWLQGGKSG